MLLRWGLFNASARNRRGAGGLFRRVVTHASCAGAGRDSVRLRLLVWGVPLSAGFALLYCLWRVLQNWQSS